MRRAGGDIHSQGEGNNERSPVCGYRSFLGEGVGRGEGRADWDVSKEFWKEGGTAA